MKRLEDYVVSIPDFPKKGIVFRDVTSVLQDPDGFSLAVHRLEEMLEGVDFDVVVGAEARGFVFAAPIAEHFHKGFIPIRKAGKLPRETISESYALEYGEATIEIHIDAIHPGQKVVLVDDLIATGGTTEAMIHLVERLVGQVVKLCFLMELAGLKGRERLKGYEIESAIWYEGA